MADYAQAIALEPRDAYVYANRGLPKLKWGILRLLKKTTRKR